MLTRLRIRNFKCFDDIDLELGGAVVFIGPNNSGKTTAMQALALWDIGLRRWSEKRSGSPSPAKRPGVTVNRRDLIAIPVPDSNLLWRDLRVRHVEQALDENGKRVPRTENIRIDVIVDGVTNDCPWSCGLEFDYANEESLYCRPLRRDPAGRERFEVPLDAAKTRVAFLPPMSGLAAVEPKWEPGRVNVLIGEGQTAQVLRNLCFQIHAQSNDESGWQALVDQIKALFGVELLAPRHIAERGEISMGYRQRRVTLDLSSSGRGLQQTLLLLAYLHANPGTVLLLDEPDAHLEVLRQRQTYKLLTDVAAAQRSQVIAASHSEVVLNEAAGRDTVIAFVGAPHRIDNGGSQVLKSLREIGFDQYLQAEQTGWLLYLESATDLAILQAFAKTLGHKAAAYLERPFCKYVANSPPKARDHFHGLREGKPDLVGLALFDRLDRALDAGGPLVHLMWSRREIENYFCQEAALLSFASEGAPGDFVGPTESKRRLDAMRLSIQELSEALRTLGKPGPWSADIKASDEFLDPLFRKFFEKLGLPLTFRKADYHVLASHVAVDQVDAEVAEVLSAIVDIAEKARPVK